MEKEKKNYYVVFWSNLAVPGLRRKIIESEIDLTCNYKAAEDILRHSGEYITAVVNVTEIKK